ncbi:hypothetical protein E2562_028403 [Oryza meyeriana var. granulata]|uniref:BED-type domain-containing protein n=1 Tax=Oryza meyeriana var. granulata TaxID=110450 RepID=A0A6G1E2X2_9ORYZ|nr:hypothetical protein E2562_028403 [Oryza meyeriana var. granulata]
MEVDSVALGIESQSSRNQPAGVAASQNQGSTAEIEVVDVDKNVGRKEMAPRSDVWQHFIKNKDDDGVFRTATCKYCRRNMKAESKVHELIEEFGAKGKGKEQASTVATTSATPTGSNSTKSISQPGTSAT